MPQSDSNLKQGDLKQNSPRENDRKRCWIGEPRCPSIRSLLIKRLAWVLTGTWILALGVIVYGATDEFEESLRSRIANTAPIILGIVSNQPNLEFFGFPEFDEDYEYAEDFDDYLMVITRNGRLMYSSVVADKAELVAIPTSGHIELADQRWEVFSVTDDDTGARVVIGFDETETWKSALQISGVTAVHFLLATVMIVVAIFFSLRSGLLPLERFADQLRRREATDLSPLDDTDLPAELDSITKAMNSHLGRLTTLLDQERDFVSNAAHELRTPLTAIQSQVEAIDLNAPPDQLAERKEHLLQATRRGARLISQLLDHSRSQSIAVEAASFKQVDLSAILQQVVADLIHKADSRKVELILDAPSNATIRSEPDLLSIVLRNLIDNAVKYADRPGRVSISVGSQSGRTSIIVEDDGPGLSDEEYGRVFEKFVRLGQSEEPGAGLGLTITSTLCDRLGMTLRRLPPGRLGGLRLELLI
ncbi:ATP-binding protein [Hwanghaeella grinnelliae]|nr:ATP-binding protein [Hwanghaeella grinnelliae]